MSPGRHRWAALALAACLAAVAPARAALKYDSNTDAYGGPLLTPTKGHEEDRDFYFEIPHNPVGVLFMAHGCVHDAADFWPPSDACPECSGAPGWVGRGAGRGVGGARASCLLDKALWLQSGDLLCPGKNGSMLHVAVPRARCLAAALLPAALLAAAAADCRQYSQYARCCPAQQRHLPCPAPPPLLVHTPSPAVTSN